MYLKTRSLPELEALARDIYTHRGRRERLARKIHALALNRITDPKFGTILPEHAEAVANIGWLTGYHIGGWRLPSGNGHLYRVLPETAPL